MPKKKRNGPSPARGPKPAGGFEGGSENSGSVLDSQSRDQIIRNMEEMFSHLDPDVIYMVLSEADFKVDNAMDSLLELSVAAESFTGPSTRISGFEQTAALLETKKPQTEPFSTFPASPDKARRSEEFDALIDQELEALTSLEDQALGSFSASAHPNHTIPDSSRSYSQTHAGSSPLSGLNFGGPHIPEHTQISLDFSHLTIESSTAEPPPSAFKVYQRPFALTSHKIQPQDAPAFWNTEAAEFRPRAAGPSFHEPVIPYDTPWTTNPTPAAQWLAHGPIRQAPSNSSATVPKSWTQSSRSRLQLEGKVLVLLRGAPGSGKTTLANAMLLQNPAGVVCSTDDFFLQNGHYCFTPSLLSEAHEWNHRRAKEAFEKGQSPIIIDNTNIQSWEMKPYVAMAQKHKYKVLFREPDTWWKTKPRELEKRTRHQVAKEKIRRILERYDRCVSVQSIMNSKAPEPVPNEVDLTQTKAEPSQEDLFGPVLSHPDLVDESVQSKLNTHYSSSLIDVSSVSQILRTLTPKEMEPSSSKSHNEIVLEGELQSSDLLAGEELDEELDAFLNDTENQSEESLEPAEGHFEGQPVAFSNSIAQRERKVRGRGRKAMGTSSDTASNGTGDESSGQVKEGICEDEVEEILARPELLSFVGDWPQESQNQRREQRHLRPKSNQETSNELEEDAFVAAEEDDTSKTCPVIEFQKLIDLLQGGEEAPALGKLDIGDSMNTGFVPRPELPDCVQEQLESTASIFNASEKTQENLAEKTSPSIPDINQEQRRVSNRRSSKSCKLALTFTNQISSSPIMPQLLPDLTLAGGNASLESSTQTLPQDFALLWRLDQQRCSDWSLSNGVVVLVGNSTGFTPKVSEMPSGLQQGIPDRVFYEKSCQVEENNLEFSHSKQHDLDILSGHFRCVSVEVLQDLYEKCHRDMEWTTNLLLDSGEQLDKDDDLDEKMETFPVSGASESSHTEDTSSDEQNGISASPQSLSPKSQDASFSAVTQGQEDWSTCQRSPSDSEGHDSEAMLSSEDSQALQLQENNEERCFIEPSNYADPEELVFPNRQGQEHTEIFTQYKGEEKEVDEFKAEVDALAELLQIQINDLEQKEEEQRKEREIERKRSAQVVSMDIQKLELKLPTELALQLMELFGPVGVSPGEFSSEDCAVEMDLSLAKLLHQKWKETIMEKHRRAALSFHLIQERSALMDEEHWTSSFSAEQVGAEELPFMDHWSVSSSPVSLRSIMKEEQVMQDNVDKIRLSRRDLDKKDSAAKLKEIQLYSMFPTIDRHFLRDIFRDHSYSLDQTKQFLEALLDDGPVKTVVAPEAAPQRHRSQSREERRKPRDEEPVQFQDTEDPEYKDFRTEAVLQRQQQIDCFNKAAEAHRQGRKEVASFYAQKGHLHGEKMREANHRAALQIFHRVNASLLPQNVLDLHGLHVDEALHHLRQVMTSKTSEWHQGLCHPQLSVITGRGNHSQGGVARIRPAVIDYLKSQRYSFTEPKMGLVLVTLN